MNTVFLVAQPGLEVPLAAEARALGFKGVRPVPGGVEIDGGLVESAEANLRCRIAVRVLWRIAAFRAPHLAQLDKRSRKLPWLDWLQHGVPVRVEAVCRRSRIYHHKAAAQRVARAVEALGIPVTERAEVAVKVRIEDDLCTISLDTSGEPLHRRGHKEFVGKAPLRETMAAGFLRQMGFDGSQIVVDPMSGSGTIPLEAADMALGLLPGRSRHFAFERLGGAAELVQPQGGAASIHPADRPRFFGFDRDQGAVTGAAQNAIRAGVGTACLFERKAISDLQPPDGPPGIVLTNPPYGARIGQRKGLFGLYGALGAVLSERFRGWRVGIVTSDAGLVKATGLSLDPFGPVDHSGMKVHLWYGQVRSTQV